MRYEAIYVDLINIYYKMYYGLQAETGKFRGRPIARQGIRGTLRKLESFCSELLSDTGKLYLCIDNFSSRIQYRKTIDSDYKANRKVESSAFYSSFRLLCVILRNYSNDYFYCYGEGLEADDLLPYLIGRNKSVTTHLVVSSDMDWARVVTKTPLKVVDWHNGKEIVYPDQFEEKYGFYPDEDAIIAYKCYRGDASDNIKPGWPRLNKEVLQELIEYGSIEDVVQDAESLEFLTPKNRSTLIKNKGKLLKNKRLVEFLPIQGHSISCKKCRHTPKIANRILGEIGLSLYKLANVQAKQQTLF